MPHVDSETQEGLEDIPGKTRSSIGLGGSEALLDVRIVVEGAADVEQISKAVQGLHLGSEYGITISSIVPTTSPEIAKKAVEGADLVLIATDADKTGMKLAEIIKEEIESEVGAVERVKIPLGHDIQHLSVEELREEIEKAIIRAGLKVLPEMRKKKKEGKSRSEEAVVISVVEELGEEVEEWEWILEEGIRALGLEGKVIYGQGYIFSVREEDAKEVLKLTKIVRRILDKSKAKIERKEESESKAFTEEKEDQEEANNHYNGELSPTQGV